jgi:tetratricopeptide (TPR) repeat protein
MRQFWLTALAGILSVPASGQSMQGMAHADTAAPKTPMILNGYGNGGFAITTGNAKAQAFFDNGMQLDAAFAHAAAREAMQESVRLDPQCAMCRWGLAWVSGPTINFTKTEDEVAELAKSVDEAQRLAKDHGTDRERSLIAALKLRYQDGGGNKPGDLAFAKAMTALSAHYPDDKQIGVMAAAAWLMSGPTSPEGQELDAKLAMPMLERILAKDPNYTPAIHFYIHASEGAGEPARAERYADKLTALAPRASHLVHMPSHTYYWVGRYEDAARANQHAVELGIENAKRLGLPLPDGIWALPYHGHNVTFGIGGALMAGDSAIGLGLARPLVARAATREADATPMIFSLLGYAAMARFAPAAEVLALPEPKSPYVRSAWHYARAEVFAAQGDAARVRTEILGIEGIKGPTNRDDGTFQAAQVPLIARAVLTGRVAMLERRYGDAAAIFREAAELQENPDFRLYSDPPVWWYPVRRDLASALLASGDPAGARREVEASLKLWPRDPAALAVLSKLGVSSASR